MERIQNDEEVCIIQTSGTDLNTDTSNDTVGNNGNDSSGNHPICQNQSQTISCHSNSSAHILERNADEVVRKAKAKAKTKAQKKKNSKGAEAAQNQAEKEKQAAQNKAKKDSPSKKKDDGDSTAKK